MRLVAEVGEETWEALQGSNPPLDIPISEVEIRQGVLSEVRQLGWLDRVWPGMDEEGVTVRVWTKPKPEEETHE